MIESEKGNDRVKQIERREPKMRDRQTKAGKDVVEFLKSGIFFILTRDLLTIYIYIYIYIYDIYQIFILTRDFINNIIIYIYIYIKFLS